MVERTRFMIYAGAPIYLAFWLLDRAVFSEQSLSLLVLRLAGSVYFAVALLATFARRGQRMILPLSLSIVYIGAAIIAAMTVLGGGFGSTYYVGIMLVVFVAGSFMPWSPLVMAIFSAAVLITYFIPNLLRHGISEPTAFMSAAFFLAASCVFATFAANANARRRWRDFELRRELERANEDLKALDEAKTRFVANISHELRTPLMLILGPLTELIEKSDDEAARVTFASMQANAQRLLRQVNAILDITKVEAGRVELKLVAGNLGRQLQALITAATPHAAARGLTIKSDGLDALPDTLFDPEKLDIVAANLLSNAIKFTDAGGEILVRASCDQHTIRFSVEDNGVGIAAEHLSRVFERFYQADNSPARPHEGTGLGLALAKELIRLHGGTIAASSRPGEGSIFAVELPREPTPPSERRRTPRRHEDKVAVTRQKALASGGYTAHTNASCLLADVAPPMLTQTDEALSKDAIDPAAPCILVVEDNPDLRQLIARGLTTEYHVVTAADGIEGLALAQQAQPDLILSDVMMPRMDGHALCRALKTDPDLAAIPVLLLTARAGSEAAVEGLAAGADDYLAKPFELKELHARLRAHLRARMLARKLDDRESRLLAIGSMTAAIAHDLKNPLTAISLLGDMIGRHIRSGNNTEAILQDLTALSSETERLTRMLVELLDFARTGAMELHRESIGVREFLEAVMKHPRRILRESGVELSIDLGGVEEAKAPIDPSRLHRVIENLLTNAREAATSKQRHEDHTPRIWVRATVRDDELFIRIADNGPGISKEVAAQLFQPFASANKARGTGLGLVMARSLVRAHHGDVEVEPKAPEGGAAFTLRLPCQPKLCHAN